MSFQLYEVDEGLIVVVSQDATLLSGVPEVKGLVV